MPDFKGLDSLTKTEEASANINLEKSKKYQSTKNRINGICKFLALVITKKMKEKIKYYDKNKNNNPRVRI